MGGRINENGEVEWEFAVPLDKQVEFYRSNPPGSFRDFKLTPTSLPDHPFDGHGEPVNAVFELACACGGDRFIAFAHYRDDGWRDDPVSLKCITCGVERSVFEARKHGYDGALGHNTYIEPRTTERVELAGDEIGAPPYRLAIRFEYPSDVLGGDFADWEGREGELYSWFTLVALSGAEGGAETIYERECA